MISRSDRRELLASPEARGIERRLLLRQGLSLGALTLLTGCDISSGDTVQSVLGSISRFNDRVQAALFSPTRLAPTFAESDVVHDFRFNASYGVDQVPQLSAADYRLQLGGLIGDKRPWTLAQLQALPQTSGITRHVCVEGWSMIGKWNGAPLRSFLERIGADLTAKYVGFQCADGYVTSLDMPSALHPQTLIATGFADGPLAPKYGFPFKIRVPTKLGFKNPKWVTAMYVTNRFPGGFWEDRGYNWFSGS